MKGILGKKIGMTQVFAEDGRMVPVTVLEVGPARVVQKKQKDVDGYEAVQLGFDETKKEKNVTKPMLGHYKKTSSPAFYFIKEIKMDGFNAGDNVTVDIFSKGELVSITGTSKGKGFQGVVKRHGFAGVGGQTHGQHNRGRAAGSLGASSFPSRVLPGMRMAGRTGGEKVMSISMRIIKLMAESNIIIVKLL